MSSSRRIRRDDFDIESIETVHDRSNNKSRSSGSRARSRSRKRSHSRRHDKGSGSRSRSIERKRNRRGRDLHSRSRSRDHSPGHSRRSDRRNQTAGRCRDTRSRSYNKSRCQSRSPYSSRHESERYRNRQDVIRNKKSSRSRSGSRSPSHFRDCNSKWIKSPNQSPRKSSSSAMASEQEENTYSKYTCENLEDLPLPKQKSEGIYHFDEDEPIDRERIHREMEEKLRAALAKEGKVYPPPKPEASHPVFANDGSFLEIFKKMQQVQASTSTASSSTTSVKSTLPIVPPIVATANPSTAPYLAAAAAGKSAPPPPIVGRRRGGKILKTGVVAKPKIQTNASADPKDFWSLYLAEVNKYKNTACESEQGNRPLVK